MVWGKWENALAAALLSAGLASGQQPGAPPPPTKGTEEPAILTLQETGKPAHKVKVLKTYRTPDGHTAYDLQDLKTGERMTIYESGTSPGLTSGTPKQPAPSAGSRLRQFFSEKVFHLERKSDAPVTTTAPGSTAMKVTTAEPPLMAAGMNAAAPLDTPARDKKTPVKGKLVSAGEGDKLAGKATATDIPPADWRQSWGKPDNHLTPGSVKGVSAEASIPATTKKPGEKTDAAGNQPTAISPKSAGDAEASVSHQTAMLRNANYPSERERAANALAATDWRAHPEVVMALTQAAQADPAASVRAACVHGLAKMNVRTEPVLAALRTLQNDKDARVRQEVHLALVILSPKSN